MESKQTKRAHTHTHTRLSTNGFPTYIKNTTGVGGSKPLIAYSNYIDADSILWSLTDENEDAKVVTSKHKAQKAVKKETRASRILLKQWT